MPVAPHWLDPSRLFAFQPLVLLCVEDSQCRVVLLAVIPTEYIQFFVVVSRSVVLDARGCLRGLVRLPTLRSSLRLFWNQTPSESWLVRIKVELILVVARFIR